MNTADYWSKTAELFGKLIDKPKMSEKLLKRPPPKYVYDIIINTMNATGFPNGLFSDEELDSKFFDAAPTNKLEILQKAIDITKIVLNEPFEIKTTNILKGDEPEKTNSFLQAFHRAATSGKECSKFISKYLDHRKKKVEEKKKKEETQQEEGIEKKTEQKHPESSGKDQALTKKDSSNTKTEVANRKNVTEKVKPVERDISQEKDKKPHEKEKEKESTKNTTQNTIAKTEGVRLARPETPIKKPAKIKDDVNEVKGDDPKKGKVPQGLISDKRKKDEDEEDETNEKEKMEKDDNLSSKATNSRGGGTSMKLDKHIFIHNDILKEENKEYKTKMNFSSADLESVKTYVQDITKNCNPIGKIIEFLSDDIELMNKELGNWEKESKMYKERYDEEVRKSEQTLLPLQNELLELEESIKDEYLQIKSIKCRLIKNEQIIQNLINNVISLKSDNK